eukprot:scaffold442_cov268-Pinguiococcus_pyrenoidosus.AAC.43
MVSFDFRPVDLAPELLDRGLGTTRSSPRLVMIASISTVRGGPGGFRLNWMGSDTELTELIDDEGTLCVAAAEAPLGREANDAVLIELADDAHPSLCRPAGQRKRGRPVTLSQ